jgi:riboflavin kinase/FMN adenylyltransferase
MQIIRSLEEITEPFKRAVVTIGNFDGVHIGHQALFHVVTETAESIGGTSVAMTFDPHPIQVLQGNTHPPLITLLEQKIELIERTTVDVLICVPFTRRFAALTPREFVEDILIRRIGMAAMVVGKDYTFGRDRSGNVNVLRMFSEIFDFQLIVADWIRLNKSNASRISSTKIRQLVMAGEVDAVQPFLGRFYQLRGTVTTGRDRGGKLLGFPTANINIQDELCPKTGVYAVTVEIDGDSYDGVANIGYSPTFDDNMFTVEVHLLDFNKDIYGRHIRVNFIKRIRDERKYPDFSALAERIKQDVAEARRIIAEMVHARGESVPNA